MSERLEIRLEELQSKVEMCIANIQAEAMQLSKENERLRKENAHQRRLLDAASQALITAMRENTGNFTEAERLRGELTKVREALDNLVDAIDRGMYGEGGLHTWECPAPDFPGEDKDANCPCGGSKAMAAARAALEKKDGDK